MGVWRAKIHENHDFFRLLDLCGLWSHFYAARIIAEFVEYSRAEHFNASRLAGIRCKVAEKLGNFDFSSKIRIFVDFRPPPPDLEL